MSGTRLLTACGLLVVALVPFTAYTNSGGAPAARTGAPGEQTCSSAGCHAGGGSDNVNTGSGSVSIGGLPEGYTPGATYALTVSVAGGTRYGFQLTAKDESSQHAGSFALIDAATRYTFNNDDYVTHRVATGTRTWSVEWTAPSQPVGPITFYAAGNAADGNGSASGDQIYTTNQTIEAGTSTPIEAVYVPDALAVDGPYPHPATDRVGLEVELARASLLRYAVFDARGRLVDAQTLGTRPAGRSGVRLRVGTWAPGVYFVRLTAGEEVSTRTVLVVR